MLTLDQMRRKLKSWGIKNYSKVNREGLERMMRENKPDSQEPEIVPEAPVVVSTKLSNNVILGDGTGQEIILRLLDETYVPYIKKQLGVDFAIRVEKDHEQPLNVPYWTGLPEWKLVDQQWPVIHLKVQGDRERKLISGWDWTEPTQISPKTKSLWFPHRPVLKKEGQYWTTNEPVEPKYPIYVISKGRWEKRLTSNSLIKMGVKHKLVVEAQERQKYIEHGVDPDNLLILPEHLCELGQGSIPVRNFIWEHSSQNGHKRHWCLDDNIDGFFRFHNNTRTPVYSGVVFSVIEDYVDRFTNVYLSGLNYFSFCPDISKRRVLCQKNTRIYSCILIQNDCEHRWRGRYNEDTDLSLRVLKDGHPTMLFNMFLCNKQTTMSCKGGNTDSIYQGDGLQRKLDSLIQQHPDCVRGTIKFKKVHHQVNYKPWSGNEAICKEPEKWTDFSINEYGMKLKA